MFQRRTIATLTIAFLVAVILSTCWVIVGVQAASTSLSPSGIPLAQASPTPVPTSRPCECPGASVCPPPPPGYQAANCYSCSINSGLKEWVPFGCEESSSAYVWVDSYSETRNGQLVCDLITTCGYEPISSSPGGGDVIPEPGTILLATGGLGIVGFYLRRWRARSEVNS